MIRRTSSLERWARECLDHASAEELAACSLLHRQESKFLLTRHRLSALIAELAPHYRVVPSGGSLVASYRTLYYDTPGFRCYQGHSERLPHHKVRVRHYDQRRVSMVEVKTRANDLRSLKFRQSKAYGDSALNAAERSFIASHLSFSADDLIPQLWTNFSRITLVGKATERVTIDCDLVFRRGDTRLRFSEVVVVEVKQDRYSENTPIMQTLAALGLGPMQVSKYGAAVALTGARVRSPRIAAGTRAPGS